MKILLTGATGFIGNTLLEELLKENNQVIATVRSSGTIFPEEVLQVKINDLFELDNIDAIQGVDTVIHCAARAHVLHENAADPLALFRQTNTIGTLNLAKQAVKAGVKRFIFLSSIGVNGLTTKTPFKEDDIPAPVQDYAISKLEAEIGLQEIAVSSGMEVVIIRPPLVYGPNAPGNFGRLMSWAGKKYPMPLPFGLVGNSRSLVAIDNLVDFIITCVTHKNATNKVFLVSDREDLSTTQLLRKIAKAFNKKIFLLPIPVQLMIFMAGLLGRKADAIRLFSSLQVDSLKAKELLDWDPKVTMDEQLLKIAKAQK